MCMYMTMEKDDNIKTVVIKLSFIFQTDMAVPISHLFLSLVEILI